jgi:SP family myo-inositol transporter-like MFS transporter 13
MEYKSKNEKSDFSDVKFESHTSQERIEDVSKAKEHAGQLAELSGIEATAASKAAWLISITVSLGGLLFGTYFQDVYASHTLERSDCIRLATDNL